LLLARARPTAVAAPAFKIDRRLSVFIDVICFASLSRKSKNPTRPPL